MDKKIIVKNAEEKFGQYLQVDIIIVPFIEMYEVNFKGREIWSFNPKAPETRLLRDTEESTKWITENIKPLENYLVNECPETKLLFLYR